MHSLHAQVMGVVYFTQKCKMLVVLSYSFKDYMRSSTNEEMEHRVCVTSLLIFITLQEGSVNPSLRDNM